MHTAPDGTTVPRGRGAVLVLLGVGSLATARLVTPDRVLDGPVLCPFRLLTGVLCPTCGMTRSWVHAAHGQWGEAFTQHALGPAVMLLVLVATIVLAVHLLTRRWWVPPRLLTGALVVLAVATGIFGAIRWIAPGVVA